MTNKKSAVKDIIVQRILADIAEGELTWKKSWNMTNSPCNYHSGHVYTGLNRLVLATDDYEDNRYLTANQAKKLGGHIREGEKGTPIIWWKAIEVGEPDEDTKKKKIVPFMRYYTIYNVTQTEGINIKPLKKAPKPRKSTAIKNAQEVVDNYPEFPPLILEENREKATFYLLSDSIYMPLMEQFDTQEEYWSTLFHELGHSTGIKGRLDRRQLDTDTGAYVYGREELIAEITASFLCAHCGITGVEDNQSAYVDGWLGVIKGDPSLVISAAGHAEKAYKFIIGEHEETTRV